MRKIVNIMMLLAGLTFFWACDTDNDHPTALTPDTFVLNAPGYASIVTDLQQSTALPLTCSQPEYGFTAATTYSIQVSLNNTWNEETETTPATYAELPTTYTTAKLSANATDLDRAVVKLSGWTEPEQLDGQPVDVFIRLKATISTLMPTIYSNSVKITVLPYYLKLTDALPATYYLIGECIGDGKWTNNSDPASIGVSIVPLSLIANQEYSVIDGTGVFTYTGYFPGGKGFKIIGVPGKWDKQWGQSDDGSFVYADIADNGAGNITLPADGWYTVTLNTITNSLKIDPASVNPSDFDAMQLVGTFEGWGTTPVVMTKTGGVNSHVWYADITFDADADLSGDDPEGCKFRANNSWDNNWGGDNFPYAVTSGKNIPYKAGTYRVVFDDLNQCYFFFVKE